jgi:hypothetical protein
MRERCRDGGSTRPARGKNDLGVRGGAQRWQVGVLRVPVSDGPQARGEDGRLRIGAGRCPCRPIVSPVVVVRVAVGVLVIVCFMVAATVTPVALGQMDVWPTSVGVLVHHDRCARHDPDGQEQKQERGGRSAARMPRQRCNAPQGSQHGHALPCAMGVVSRRTCARCAVVQEAGGPRRDECDATSRDRGSPLTASEGGA